MKKAILSLIAAFCSVTLVNAGVFSYFSYCTFNTPDNKPYVETYITVLGKSIQFTANPSGKYQGTVDLSIVFLQGEEIKAFKKVSVSSPETKDTLERPNFLSLERFPLPNGKYTVELEITDHAGKGTPVKHKQEIEINYPENEIMVSDIQRLESFRKSETQTMLSKNGYEMVPYVSNFYPSNLEEMPFYAEIYNTEKKLGAGERFVIFYYIESFETGVRLNDYNGFSRQTVGPVNMVLANIKIKELASGRYNLVIEARDKNNVPIGFRKIYFERSNPAARLDPRDVASVNVEGSWVLRYSSMDTLAEHIRSLRPISSESEKLYAENQLKGQDVKLMQQYFLSFWMNRDRTNSETAWKNYELEVRKAQGSFGTQIMKGYETDRGRVYLQYGPPDQREEVPSEPSAYPYEVWQYYKLKDQTNKKFIFYNPDLVTNNYKLLHSDAKGEIYDSRWNLKLHKRNNTSRDIDQGEVEGGKFGSNSKDIFRDPK